jgi:CRP-like cAMP-binding protein
VQELIQQRMKALYFRPPSIKLPSASEVVRRHPLFAHLSPENLQRVLEVGDTHIFDPNSKIFEVGQTATRVYLVLRGTVSKQVRVRPSEALNSPLSVSLFRCIAVVHARLSTQQPTARLRCARQTALNRKLIIPGAFQAKDGTHVHINGVGAAFGMSEVIYEVPRRSTVIANDTVEVFYLPAKAFRHTMASDEEVLVLGCKACLPKGPALAFCRVPI